MITNQQQYEGAKKKLSKVREDIRPRAEKTSDDLLSKYASLCFDIREYETLKERRIVAFDCENLESIGSVLVQVRIARNMSQVDLAEALDCPESNIRRDENKLHTGVSLSRLCQIANILHLKFSIKVEL